MLNKRKNDIKFFNLETGEVVCTFNQCCHKFTIEGTQEATSTPVVGVDANDDFIRETVVSEVHFHQCEECGRKVSSKTDRSKTFDDYRKSKHKQVYRKKPNPKIVEAWKRPF
jgi:hypothetical protein